METVTSMFADKPKKPKRTRKPISPYNSPYAPTRRRPRQHNRSGFSTKKGKVVAGKLINSGIHYGGVAIHNFNEWNKKRAEEAKRKAIEREAEKKAFEEEARRINAKMERDKEEQDYQRAQANAEREKYIQGQKVYEIQQRKLQAKQEAVNPKYHESKEEIEKDYARV